MKTIGIYARVSKAEQDDPTSIPVQLADCRERAAEEGWEVAEEYVDEGISAWNTHKKRPAYERLLADVEVGRFDTILVRETERLLRQQKEAVRIADLAEAGRLRLIACTLESDVNFARARDRKDFRDRASSAQFYSEFLSEKIRRTKARRKAEGGWNGGGRRPFGYRFANRRLEIVDAEAKLLREAVTRILAGASLYRVCIDWNAAGLRTPYENRWKPAHLRRTLTSPVLLGGGDWDAILSEDQQALLAARLSVSGQKGKGRPSGRRYAASGLLLCGGCDTKLMGSAGHYCCPATSGGCTKVRVPAYPLERWLVRETLTHQIEGQRKGRKKRRKAAALADTAPLVRELRDVEERIGRLALDYADGTLTAAQLRIATEALEERRQALIRKFAANVSPPEAPQLRMGDFVTIEDIDAALGGEYLNWMEKAGLDVEDQRRVGTEFRERWEARNLTESEVAQVHEWLVTSVEEARVQSGKRYARTFDPSLITVSWLEPA